MWKCSVCQYITDAADAPDVCPRCGAPKEKFVKLADDKANLIKRARLTNGLHEKLHAVLDEVEEISDRGIADNLDSACVKIFEKARDDAKELKQWINAEIEVHISKGKWG